MEAKTPVAVDVATLAACPDKHANVLAIGDGICKGLAALISFIAMMMHHAETKDADEWTSTEIRDWVWSVLHIPTFYSAYGNGTEAE